MGRTLAGQDLVNKSNHMSSGLTMLMKVKKENVLLNSYSRMRVNLAAQVWHA